MTTAAYIDLESLDDEHLVERAQTGDQAAFAELYNRYFSRIYDFLARMMRNRTEAEDVAQDTFVRAYNSIDSLQTGAKFKSWIFTIARNTALNRIEQSKRIRPLQYDAGDEDEVELDLVDKDKFSSPDEAVRAAETASIVWSAAAGLSPKQYSLLDLHLRQGLDSAEIADVLGVTKNNGYVMLNRLKTAVEESIGAYVMMREGRSVCPDLDQELTSIVGSEISPGTRRLITRHVKNCPTCQKTQSELVSPSAILGALIPIPAAPGVQNSILESVLDSGTPGGSVDARTSAAVEQAPATVPALFGRHIFLLSAVAISTGLLLFLAAFFVPVSRTADSTTAQVAIRFETAAGNPVDGVTVSLLARGSDNSSTLTATTDSSGKATFSEIVAGPYEIIVQSFPEEYSQLEVGQSTEFIAEAGQEMTILGVFQISDS